MALKVNDTPYHPIFLNIDKHWTGNGHILHLLPQFKQETRMILGNFILYLIYHKGKWIETLFSAESLIVKSENKLDEKRGFVKGFYENEFNYTSEDNPIILAAIKYISISDSNTITSSIFNKELLHHLIPSILQKRLFGICDEDSVSTLVSREKLNFKRHTPFTHSTAQLPDLSNTTDDECSFLIKKGNERNGKIIHSTT